MRRFSIFLLLLCLLGLISCGAPMTPSSVTPGSSADGITLETQFPVYAPDIEVIQFRIENHSGKIAEFGTTWTLERMEDDVWYTIPFAPDTGFTMPLILLADGGASSGAVHLSMLDHKLKKGSYRIVKEINGTPYTVEFTVGDSPVGKNSPYGYAPPETLSTPSAPSRAEKM